MEKKISRRAFMIGLGALGGTIAAASAGAWLLGGSPKLPGESTASGELGGPAPSLPPKKKPNIVVILADDMGYSDIGCYGGMTDTPNLDALAANGVRLTQFTNTARCSPSRASLLTGLHPHQAGMAHLQGMYGPYTEKLNDNCVTIAEVLKESGYGTYMAGKWHLGSGLPHQRGFDQAYHYPGGDFFSKKGIMLNGGKLNPDAFGSEYYSTDDMTTRAIGMLENHRKQAAEKPFFLYMTYTAPHFPLQAKAKDIAKYKGRFDQGWDALRKQKFDRMKQMGLIDPRWELPALSDSGAPSWDKETSKSWRLRAMEVYAAMVDCMDQNIGRLVETLRASGELENTLLLFLSDNGGNAEFLNIKNTAKLPGGPGYAVANGHYGAGWASLSNTPFRMFKHYVHQGGIATPFIVHWPAGLKEKGVLRKTPAQLTDMMPTVLEASGSSYPETFKGRAIIPSEGRSMIPIFQSDQSDKSYLFWEHEGNCGVRHNQWKLVKFEKYAWELYDLEKDGTEMHDLAAQQPDLVKQLSDEYEKWAKRANVLKKEDYMKYAKGDKDGEGPNGPINLRTFKGAAGK
ncbi:Arylsulfatase [Paenibacillus solanacearum]|uniref:Arylsulfatase n=1 Tax=Paenibacillus solanacearum TaxID=2048548 RepID=A0A916JTY1_9BACL|nr:arylsulfatase [Paenibacillus solanacearum]CAG7598807.1 Arylsulfatase [Paenibacillus solanacearum]